MNKLKVISDAIAKFGGDTLLKAKAASPKLLLIGGIVVGAAAIVSACCATTKLDEVTEEVHKDLDSVQAETDKEMEAAKDENGHIDEKVLKDIVAKRRRKSWKATLKAAARYARLYALPFVLAVLAVVMLVGSHGILNSRYLSTAAAYTALDEAFRDYRGRVAEAVGDDTEKEIYTGTRKDSIVVTDNEGNVTEKTDTIKCVETKQSPYEFDFNKSTAPLTATTNEEHNWWFVHKIEDWANDKLNAQGHLFLNEVLDELGMDRTSAGAVIGWRKHSKGNGDGYVKFNPEVYYSDDMSDMLCGYSFPNIHLSFNCDAGTIYDKI